MPRLTSPLPGRTVASSSSDGLGDLTPGSFEQTTSARETHSHPAPLTNLALHRGQVGFRLFVDSQKYRALIRLLTTTTFEPVIILHNLDHQRTLYGEPDELPHHFADRAAREAAAMQAFWAFTAIVCPFHVGPTASTVDISEAGQVDAALARHELDVGIAWSAIRRDGHREYHAGVLLSDGEVPGDVDESSDPFRNILG